MMEKVTQMIAMLIKAWKKESVSQIDTPPVPATPEPKQQSPRSEEHTSELQSRLHLVCRLLLEKRTTRHPCQCGGSRR